VTANLAGLTELEERLHLAEVDPARTTASEETRDTSQKLSN